MENTEDFLNKLVFQNNNKKKNPAKPQSYIFNL